MTPTPDWRSPPSPPPPSFLASTGLIHTAGRLCVGLLIRIWMASLPLLSNHFCYTSTILTLSKLMLWSGWSQFICLETYKFTELGLLCSHESRFQRPPRLPNVRVITVITADVVHRTHTPLLRHLVFQPHQYLSKCIGGLELHFQPVSFHHSSHLFGDSFHIWDYNWTSLRFYPGQGGQM